MSEFDETPPGWIAPRWMDQAAGASWRLLVTLAFVAVLVAVLIAADVVVLPLLLALMITSVLHPITRLIQRRGVSRGWASLLTLVAVVAAVLIAVTVAVRQLAGSWGDLAAGLSQGLDKLEQRLQGTPLHLSHSQAHQTTNAAQAIGAKVVGILAQGVVSVVPAITAATATGLLTLVMTFFFLRDGRNIWRWSMMQVPGANLSLLDQIASRSRKTIGGYVKGQAIIATFDGVMIGLGLALIGVPLVLPLAILTFFLAFIPTLGAIIAGAAATLIALAHGGLTEAVLVILLTLAVNQSEALLSPFVVGRAVNLHPLGAAGIDRGDGAGRHRRRVPGRPRDRSLIWSVSGAAPGGVLRRRPQRAIQADAGGRPVRINPLSAHVESPLVVVRTARRALGSRDRGSRRAARLGGAPRRPGEWPPVSSSSQRDVRVQHIRTGRRHRRRLGGLGLRDQRAAGGAAEGRSKPRRRLTAG